MTAPPATTAELRHRGGLRVLGWPALDRPGSAGRGAEVLVTTRPGGVSEGPYATLNLSFSVGDDPRAVLENTAMSQPASYDWSALDLDDLIRADRSRDVRQEHAI